MDKKLFVALVALLLLFGLASCKKDAEVVLEVEEEGSVEDYFDTVLEDSPLIVVEEKDPDLIEEEVDDDEPEDIEEEEKEVYGATECGDDICQYYETYSSCSEDCEKLVDITLGDYPDFLEDVLIVVGDSAPSTDVLTAAVLGTYFVTVDIDSKTILASELEVYDDDDLILIGSPCNNEALVELYHYGVEGCDEIISGQNNAVIKLTVQEDNEIISITGYNAEDTMDASQMLTNGEYNLNGAEEWINLFSDGTINLYFSKN
jgi:hypothetical protein